jgi:hypothetical protein
MMKEEMWRHLPKTKLPGCYYRVVKFISRFDDTVESAHADWEETRTNHDGVQAPGVDIVGKISQSERGWALKDFRLSIGEEDWVVQTFVKNLKPP